VRRRSARIFRAMLGADGVLLLPTVPGAAPRLDAPPEDSRPTAPRRCGLLCLAGLSAARRCPIPVALDQGAPFGLSLIGPPVRTSRWSPCGPRRPGCRVRIA